MSEVQLIVFKLDGEEYGVGIMHVQEIGPYQRPMHVPNTPSFVEGIINLRGDVIPIVSLKKRFNMFGNDTISEFTRIVVMNINERSIGFVVDDASEVLTIDDKDIDPAPEIIAGNDRKYISGIGKQGERLLIILDMNKLFSDEEQKQMGYME